MSTGSPRPIRYCLSCGTENARSADLCRRCGRRLLRTADDETRGAAFVLNELEAWRDEQEVGGDLYLRLRDRYLPFLRTVGAVDSPLATRPTIPPPPAAAAPAPRVTARPRREGPGWLAEQQANLLLYLGAFLIVIAALVYVGYSGQASYALNDSIKMALLSAYTLFFLLAGLLCLRSPRVQQAGIVFFALGSLMVPINFVGAYGFFYADGNVDPTGLWLAGSICSALFYAAISYAGLSKWYSVPMVIAAYSALSAVLVLSDARIEAYPGSFIALSVVLALPQLLPLGKVSETFGDIGALGANLVVPVALLVAWALTTGTTNGGDEYWFELRTRWYFPPTVALGALFYWGQALSARRVLKQLDDGLTVVALALSGAAILALVYALDVGYQWYGPAVAGVGFAYSALLIANAGSKWAGNRHLVWMSLSAVTVSWLLFESVYDDFPAHGAGVHFAAAAFYLGAARFINLRVPFVLTPATDRQAVRVITLSASIGLAYAAALAAGVGVYYVLEATQEVATADAGSMVWTFFGVSLGIAAVAATMRWWWPELKLHIYGIAFGMSLFVLLTAASAEGQVTLLLSIYAAAALALTIWEREPLGLVLPAGYGFFALLAAWRLYEPDDAYLPIVIVATAGTLLALSPLLKPAARSLGWGKLDERWATVLQALGFAYVVAAPVTGGIRLAMIVDDAGYVATTHFESTHLFWSTAGTVAAMGLAGATTRWWWSQVRLPVYGIALAMSIGIVAAATDSVGLTAVVLLGYSALAFALTLWESEPFGLSVPAGFGLFGLLAAWFYYEPNDLYLPLAVSGIAVGLFIVGLAIGAIARQLSVAIPRRLWADVVEGLAFFFAGIAPIIAWARLSALADDSGFVGSSHFEVTALYQTCAASVAILALLVFVAAWLRKRLDIATLGSALTMVAGLLYVGHFHPENLQAYTAPLGVYVLAMALLSLRVKLPENIRELLPAIELLGAALIMGPSFAKSLDEDAWGYGLILLAEGIGFVALALVQRRIWLMGAATTFVVVDGAHYLFFAGGPALPNWAILAIAGTAVMAAGTAILLGREGWAAWQKKLQVWWYRDALA